MRIHRDRGTGCRPASLMASPARGSRRTLGLLGCAAVALVLAGVAATASSAAKATQTLTIGMATGPESLDPAKNGTGPSQVWVPLFAEPIIHVNADGSYSPGLATSWRYTKASNKQFEFTLRRDARFSDGTPVTAQAVKTWLDYFASANGPALLLMGPIASVETVGKWTVRINLKSPNPIIPLALSQRGNWGSVESPRAVENPSVLGSQTFGAGPYVLVPSQSVTNDHYTFVPNKHYFDKQAIRYSKVVVKIIPNLSSLLQAQKTGQVDVAMGHQTTADAAEAGGLQVVKVVPGVQGLVFLDRGGTLQKALGDVRVRQALNYAIDRKAITTAIQGKWGSPTSSIFTPETPLAAKYQSYYSYDPAKARALLAAAGYGNGFTFDALGGTPALDPLTPAIAKYLAAVGVKLNWVSPSTNPEWAQKLFSGTMSTITIGTGNNPMWIFYQFFLGPKGPLNQHGWVDATMNKAWLKGQRAAKSATSYWKQIQERAVTQASFLPVFTYYDLYYVGKHTGGVKASTVAYPDATEWSPK